MEGKFRKDGIKEEVKRRAFSIRHHRGGNREPRSRTKLCEKDPVAVTALRHLEGRGKGEKAKAVRVAHREKAC